MRINGYVFDGIILLGGIEEFGTVVLLLVAQTLLTGLASKWTCSLTVIAWQDSDFAKHVQRPGLVVSPLPEC